MSQRDMETNWNLADTNWHVMVDIETRQPTHYSKDFQIRNSKCLRMINLDDNDDLWAYPRENFFRHPKNLHRWTSFCCATKAMFDSKFPHDYHAFSANKSSNQMHKDVKQQFLGMCWGLSVCLALLSWQTWCEMSQMETFLQQLNKWYIWLRTHCQCEHCSTVPASTKKVNKGPQTRWTVSTCTTIFHKAMLWSYTAVKFTCCMLAQ